MMSRPWPETRDVLNNATEEVLAAWQSRALPRGTHLCRKIVFTIKSHDQGWGGPAGCRGTYNGSSTWFDYGLEKVSAFRETKQQEASELAPLPQFRLDHKAQGKQPSPPDPPVLCSLRTILPPTRPLDDRDPNTSYEFRFDLDPGATCLQRNVVAKRETKEHKITWSCGDNINPESAEANALSQQGRGPATGTGEFVRNLKLGDVVTVWAKARYGGWVNHVDEVKIDVYWAV